MVEMDNAYIHIISNDIDYAKSVNAGVNFLHFCLKSTFSIPGHHYTTRSIPSLSSTDIGKRLWNNGRRNGVHPMEKYWLLGNPIGWCQTRDVENESGKVVKILWQGVATTWIRELFGYFKFRFRRIRIFNEVASVPPRYVAATLANTLSLGV